MTETAGIETTPDDAARVEARLSIVGDWLVEDVDHHTCGTGPDGHYGAHEPGCGTEPVMPLDQIDGLAYYEAAIRADERAQIAARRDEVAEATYEFDVYVPGVTPPWERLPEPTRDHYRAMADYVLAALEVSDR